jgi:hypothetical protein
MLAYLSWHRAAAGVEQERYEQALAHFHRSLSRQPPSGFHGSVALRVAELPWLAALPGAEDAPGYEDWYLIDDWSAVGVLEEAAVSHGHRTVHDASAALAGAATGSVYRLVEGSPRLDAHVAVWVTRKPGRQHPSLEALLGDGIEPQRDGLWRRCLGLGPAPEYCLLAAEAPAGVASSRLPDGWIAQTPLREEISHG